MANKRLLKKQIKMACGDLAAESITAMHLIPGVNREKLNEAVLKTAGLQSHALENSNVSFDKAPRDFANMAAYRKARRKYFAAAYHSLRENFNTQVDAIIKEMNEALPKKA